MWFEVRPQRPPPRRTNSKDMYMDVTPQTGTAEHPNTAGTPGVLLCLVFTYFCY